MIPVSQFPTLKIHEVIRLLERAGYRLVRQKGSHRRMAAPGRPPITLSMHSGELSPRHLRNLLVNQARLSDEEVRGLLWGRRRLGGFRHGSGDGASE